jgi:HAD superfamily hydrolase (TIGR01509 family)
LNPVIQYKKYFLFDLDGTLVDSNELHSLAFQQVLSRSAPEILTNFDYEGIKGRRTSDVFAEYGFSDAKQIALLTAEKQSAYASAIAAYGLPLIAGAREILDFLSGHRRTLYLVSAGSRASVEDALRAAQIRNYFSGVITSDDVARSKPSPDIYRKCLDVHDLSTASCVAVEDSESGVQASIGAGIDSVMVSRCAETDGSYELFPTLENFYEHLVEVFGDHRE